MAAQRTRRVGGAVKVGIESLEEGGSSGYFFVRSKPFFHALRVQYLKSGESSYLVVRLDDASGRPLVIGYNDMFAALGISRAFSGNLWRVDVPGVETYLATYRIDESVYATVGKAETLYKYFSTAILPELIGLNPARIGAEVTLPPVSAIKENLKSDWGKALYIELDVNAPRLDILGIMGDGSLVVGEVKNMANVGGPSDMELDKVAKRAEALYKLIEEDPGYVAALVSAFNGGGSEGGRVSTAFFAKPSLVLPQRGDPNKIKVKFVVVLADRDKAAIFIFDTTLAQLMNVHYLVGGVDGRGNRYEGIANIVYRIYKNIDSYGRSSYGSISDVVDEVIDRYAEYSPVVRWLK